MSDYMGRGTPTIQFSGRLNRNHAWQRWLARSAIVVGLVGLGYFAMAGRAALPLPGLTISGVQHYYHGRLYLDPAKASHRVPPSWLTHRPQDAYQLNLLAHIPTAIWLGDWTDPQKIGWTARERLVSITSDETAVIAIYNIPHRDCSSYSRGGAATAYDYGVWIRQLASAIAEFRAIIILEPDALAGLDCLSLDLQLERYRLIRDAVMILSQYRNKAIYLDAGHSAWQPAAIMAQRLTLAGIDRATGFSLNVSNFNATTHEIEYGQALSSRLNGKHFVVDTSRNGAGPDPNLEWCNPQGRSIGELPTLQPSIAAVDALLWIKVPGESDGDCRPGDSPAGTWQPEYALELIRNSHQF